MANIDDWGKGDEVVKTAPKEEPGFLEPGSKSDSAIRAFSNAATFGLAPRISALARMGKDQSYSQGLQEYLDADKAAQVANPKTSFAAGLAPSLLQAAATGGGSLVRQGATNAALGAVNAAGNAQEGQVLKDATTGGAVAGALSLAPAAVGKGIDAAKKYTSNTAVQGLEDLLKNKPKGWEDQVAKMLGTSKKEMKEIHGSVKEYAKEMLDTVKGYTKGTDNIQLSDIKEPLTGMINSTTPTIKQVLTNTKDAARDALIGGGAVGGINYALGSPVDPATAILAAGSATALGGMKELGKNVAKKSVMSIGKSDIPETLGNWATANPTTWNTTKQITSQIGASEVQDRESSGGFKRLTDFLSNMSEDEKRKQAMNMSSTPEGRSFGNDDSPVKQQEDDWGKGDATVR